MAIRHRAGRASPWQCYWNNPITGRRECANFATRHEAEKHDSLIKHRTKFDRESFQKGDEEKGEKNEVLTLEACYLEYLKQKKFNKKSLAWQMDSIRYPLRKLGAMPVQDITKKHIEPIMEEMLAMPVKPVTVRGRLSVLRTVLRWCAERGFREPMDFPRLPTSHFEKFVPPTPDELRAILACAPPHIVRVVIMGAQLGVRVGPSELLRLTWNDVDLEQRILRIHGARKNPNAPWREVPIRQSLVSLFEEWRKKDAIAGMKYLVHFNGKPVSTIKCAWKNALHRAGITRRIRPYDLRHAFGTELIAGGVDVGTVASLMGHSNPTMLLTHYQYVMDKQKRSAVEALPEVHHVPIKYVSKEETHSILSKT